MLKRVHVQRRALEKKNAEMRALLTAKKEREETFANAAEKRKKDMHTSVETIRQVEQSRLSILDDVQEEVEEEAFEDVCGLVKDHKVI